MAEPVKMSREALRLQMLNLIRGYSEEHYAAGWMMGIEGIIRGQGGLWTLMAAACGGWPQGLDGEDGWAPLTDEERVWLADLGWRLQP